PHGPRLQRPHLEPEPRLRGGYGSARFLLLLQVVAGTIPGRAQMTAKRIALVGVVACILLGGFAAADQGGDKTLLDNDQVLVMEIVFPPGFKGDEHEAPVNEFAYVLDGE